VGRAGRLVGNRPADGGLAASHRPASSSPPVQQPLGEPEPSRPAGAVGPKGLVVAGQGGGGALIQRGVDHARLHQHHPYAEGGQLQPQRVRGRLQREPRRRVEAAAWECKASQDAGDVDDAAGTSLAHRRQEGPGDGQGAEQVDLQLRPGLLLRDGLHRTEDEDPGGVDQHVQPGPAGLGGDLVVGVVDGGGVGDVQDDRADPGVGGGEGLELPGSTGAGEDDVAGVGEADGGGPADPPEAPVTRMNRWTGGGAGLAGTGVAWVVMGSALRDGEGLIEVVVVAAVLFGLGSLRTPRAGSAAVQAPRGTEKAREAHHRPGSQLRLGARSGGDRSAPSRESTPKRGARMARTTRAMNSTSSGMSGAPCLVGWA
jgi:hypothetical protein